MCVDDNIVYIVLYAAGLVLLGFYTLKKEKDYKIILEDEKEVYFYRYILNTLKRKKEAYNLLINVKLNRIGLSVKAKAIFVITNKLSQPLIFVLQEKDINEKDFYLLKERYKQFMFCRIVLDNKIKTQYKIQNILKELK